MIVYRVEHRESGYGPYVLDNPALDVSLRAILLQRELNSQHRGDQWPVHRVDGLCSGFTSMKKLRKWFQGFESKLAMANYVVRVFKVRTFCPDDGLRQVLFNRGGAELLRTASL